jgi:hypothetical protein
MVLGIEELKPGMVLAESVRNHQNQLLLDVGRKVTDKSIRVFKSWGIRRVAVRTGPAGEYEHSASPAAGASLALDESLKARFAEVVHDPIMAAIMQAAGRQLAVHRRRKNSSDGRR